MNFASSGCLRATVFAGGNENGGGKRDFHRRDIDNLFESQPLSKKIVGRSGDSGVDGTRLKSGKCLADIAELNVLQIFKSIDLKSGKRCLSKHIWIRADAVDAQPLAL